MTSDAYKKIMWGILVSGCHMVLWDKLQIIPAFVGYALIWWGLHEINGMGGKPYYEQVEKQAMFVCAISVGGWIAGILCGYANLFSMLCMGAFYLIEWLLYADLLNRSVKLLKETNRIREANSMRKNRMRVMVLFLAVIIVYCVEILFAVLRALNVGKFSLAILLDYAVLTLLLLTKIWMSMFIQNLYRYEITIDKKD